MMRLCEIVADITTLWSNEWEVVATKLEKRREGEDPVREKDSLRKKLDKLAANKKSTGDQSFPEEVRVEKQEEMDIGGQTSSGEVGDNSSDDENEYQEDQVESKVEIVGRSVDKQRGTSHGIKRNLNGEEILIEHVESMLQAYTQI